MASQAPSVIFTRVYRFQLTNHQPALNHILFTSVLSTDFSGSTLFSHILCSGLLLQALSHVSWTGTFSWPEAEFHQPVFLFTLTVDIVLMYPFKSLFHAVRAVSSIIRHEKKSSCIWTGCIFGWKCEILCKAPFLCRVLVHLLDQLLPYQTFFLYVCIYSPFSAGWWSKALNHEPKVLKL